MQKKTEEKKTARVQKTRSASVTAKAKKAAAAKVKTQPKKSVKAEVCGKEYLIEAVAKKMNGTKVDARKYVNAFEEAVKETLRDGKEIRYLGLFKARVNTIPEHEWHNPMLDKTVLVKEKNVVKMSASKRILVG